MGDSSIPFNSHGSTALHTGSTALQAVWTKAFTPLINVLRPEGLAPDRLKGGATGWAVWTKAFTPLINVLRPEGLTPDRLKGGATGWAVWIKAFTPLINVLRPEGLTPDRLKGGATCVKGGATGEEKIPNILQLSIRSN